MEVSRVKEVVKELTLEEKAGLCSGANEWQTKAVSRLGIPAIRVSDDPHGMRVVSDDSLTGGSKQAVCFPAGCASGASFDRNLMRRLGTALGKECQAMDVQVLLGPGINMKRSPLCGRNFEYFSEDPYLTGELAASYVDGVQSQGVGTSLKHFFANNQEYRRMDASSQMDERTMRELYLSAFETVVRKSQPWSIMASYNKIDGTYATEHKAYLDNVLRKEWGFEGAVVSDWGATHNRVKAVRGGTDLTMPGEPQTDKKLVEALNQGTLSEAELDKACEHVLNMVFKGIESKQQGVVFDMEADHILAREIAGESMVLLKNQDDILPLNKEQKIAFIGEFAKAPRYQGGGSSHINSTKVTNAYDSAIALKDSNITYAKGYVKDSLIPDKKLIEEAKAIAKVADIAVVFAGLPEKLESEGYDREHLQLPESHNQLIEAIASVQPNIVVVLHNGAPVEMPWEAKIKGILEVYLGGQAVGEATIDILFGEKNPSGRLPESFPKRVEDTPSYTFFPGERGKVYYSERMFTGYRYYESKKMEVLFPFGHGLSYTTFSYDNLRIRKDELGENDTLDVAVNVTNTGKRRGKEVVQLYVSHGKGEMLRPLRELKGFDKIELAAGETKTVHFTLQRRDFAYWNVEVHDWIVESGTSLIQIGASAHQILAEKEIKLVASAKRSSKEYTKETTLGEFIQHPVGKQVWLTYFDAFISGLASTGMIPKEELAENVISPENKEAIKNLLGQPVSLMVMFVPDLAGGKIENILEEMNHDEKE